jgi:hypothetical protein
MTVCLWIHAKRHHDIAGRVAYCRARMDKDLMEVLGVTFDDLLNRHH